MMLERLRDPAPVHLRRAGLAGTAGGRKEAGKGIRRMSLSSPRGENAAIETRDAVVAALDTTGAT